MSIFKQLFKNANKQPKQNFEPEEALPSETLSNDALNFEVRELLAQGKKIQAIKLVRNQTGWGLKQAKDFVDSLG